MFNELILYVYFLFAGHYKIDKVTNTCSFFSGLRLLPPFALCPGNTKVRAELSRLQLCQSSLTLLRVSAVDTLLQL